MVRPKKRSVAWNVKKNPRNLRKRKSQAAKNTDRGRRSLFKKKPVKAPQATATCVTSDYVFYKGKYMQAGDIVSMIDVGGGTFYAQIRSFMTDEYYEKSAVVSWILPTKASPPPEECFDPQTYIMGPDEDLPRKLDYMEFIMHAPPNYYKTITTPYCSLDQPEHTPPNFIWASAERVYRK